MNPERRNECATVKNGNLGKRAVAATTSITGMNEKSLTRMECTVLMGKILDVVIGQLLLAVDHATHVRLHQLHRHISTVKPEPHTYRSVNSFRGGSTSTFTNFNTFGWLQCFIIIISLYTRKPFPLSFNTSGIFLIAYLTPSSLFVTEMTTP